MPILKQLVNNSNQSKRRSRIDLTAEMISAPLGDFRHTMHVGRGGDAFGDTSFLSTRSGEPPKEQQTAKQSSPGSKPGLLSRTFRSSKRSQSVNHADKYDYNTMLPSSSSSSLVKNAISLPYLNNEDTNRSNQLSKSVSSSPLKTTEIETKPSNGAASIATLDAEFDERNFGELTDLLPSMPRGGGMMKHAESMMSFHIDLGPSMLGDILSVMEKKGWEDDDLGYEEGKDCRESPSHIPHIDDDVEELAPIRPPRSMYQQKTVVDPYTPELHTRNNYHNLDTCSMSSSGSVTEGKPQYHHHDGDTDSAKFSSPRGGSDRDFTYMDEEDDDEIRV